MADADESVIHEKGGFSLGTEGFGDLLTLLFGGDDAAVLVVYGEGAIHVADVLGDHVEGLAKGAPSATGDGVGVADGLDVGSDLVNLGVNVKAGVVCRSGLGSSGVSTHSRCVLYDGFPIKTTHHIAAHNLASVDIQAQHVSSIEKGKVLANWVHPDEVVELRVPDADMTRDALGESNARPVAEDGGHVQGDVSAVLIVRAEGWDA